MIGPVVSGGPIVSKVMLLGQAPGPHEGKFGKPFAWTAGKTLFRWFGEIGLDEEKFRTRVYMAAVCRCFPGKNPKGGDRVPDATEIQNCLPWFEREIALLEPELIIPVGKLAIGQILSTGPLAEVVGGVHRATVAGRGVDIIPLPHPSGASTWHRTEPGKTLLAKGLGLIAEHSAYRPLIGAA